ncbi:MAG: nucleotidyltransferase domain-containing protein [Candidatus Bathyarchaeia archaeon]
MAHIRLRDRDAIVTSEGLIFRVLGYVHPPEGYICDVEYAPSEIYRSSNLKAFRSDGKNIFYKFYGDEGWKFLLEKYPQYMLYYRPLGRKVIGVKYEAISEVRKPEERLRQLSRISPTDSLTHALQKILTILVENHGLSLEDFGVFGSLLHGFYSPKFSDLDLIVYGRECLKRVRSILGELCGEEGSPITNEFANNGSIKGKVWRFKNIGPSEYLWHQRRKMIYVVFHDEQSKRMIKTEFEPVKSWSEISGESQEVLRVRWVGWVKAVLRITDDRDSPFMPSIYHVEPLKIIKGPRCDDIQRVVSYVEEFRMQCFKDEIVYAEGNLEEVETRWKRFHQIALTYGPRYYEQALKTVKSISLMGVKKYP